MTEGGTGSGSVTDNMSAISCTDSSGNVTGSCSANYASGAQVTLTASAAAGSTFVSWGGGACATAGTNPTCTVTLNEALNVSASFVPGVFTTANVCPGGATSPSPCSATFSVTFNFTGTTAVSGIQALTQGLTGLDFSAVNSGSCINTFSAGNSCSVTVTFTPQAPGLRLGAVELLSDSNVVLATQLIYGVGEAPEAAFGPTVTFTPPLTPGSAIFPSSQVTEPPNLAGPLTTDAAGNLYQANSLTVQKLAPPYTGSPTTVAMGFDTPVAAAIDGAGNLYVADSGLGMFGEVVELPPGCASTSCGSILYEPTVHPNVAGVAVDGSGDVFISDNPSGVFELPANGGSQIMLYNPGGNSTPQGLAVDAAGDLFVADSGLSKVVEIPAGCTTAGCQINIGSGWSSPSSVAVDAAGDVIVADFTLTIDGEGDAGGVVEVPAGCTTNACQILLLTAGAPDPYAIALTATGQLFVATDGPFFEIDQSQPPLVSFGSASVGSDVGPDSVTVQNIGNQTLAGSVGALSAGINFAELSSTCTSFSLTPGALCAENFEFEPQSTGGLTDQAYVIDNSLNATSATQTINLSGTGMATASNQLTVTAIGSGSGTVSSNPGSIDCIDASGSLSGTCSGNFTANSQVTLTASPTGTSAFLGWGGACASSGTSPTCLVTLNSGVTVTASFGQQNFGASYVCSSGFTPPVGSTCSSSQSVIFNLAATTTIGAIQVVTQGVTGLDFAEASGGTCTGTIAAGNSCSVNVSFTPLAPGLRLGAVQLYASNGSLAATMPIYGVGQGPVAAFIPATQTTVPVSGLGLPYQTVEDAAGNLYIADSHNSEVFKITPGGVQTAIPATGLNGPSSAAVDGAGNIFITDSYNARVVEVTPAGVQTTVPTTGLSPSLNGLALDGRGDIFFGDGDNNRVVEITSSGVQTTVGSGLKYPSGVAVDGSGDVFIADSGNNRVVEVTPGGVQTVVPASGLHTDYGVAVDAAGDVFIADSGNNQVVEVTPGGVQTTVLNGLNDPLSVAVDAAGNIFVDNTYSGQVLQLGRSRAPSLNFGQTTAGARTGDIGITVQNVGNESLAVSVSSPSTANFGLDLINSTCSSIEGPLAPGGTCVQGIYFQPQSTALGLLTDGADFYSNSLNLASSVSFQTVNLSGIANGANGQTGTVVPNLVGMTESAAASTLSSVGLTLGTVGSQYSDSQPSGSVVGESPAAGAQVSFGATVALMLSTGEAPPQQASPLTFENNYFVTGDYASGGVTLRQVPATGGMVNGTITIPVNTAGPGSAGVPNGADIVDGYLYWTTLEQTGTPSGGAGTFLGYPITGAQVGSDIPKYSDGASSGTLRVYRADINNYFQVQTGWNGERLGSGTFAVSLPDTGIGTNGVVTEGASLVVIYRVLSQNFPLKSVILYDGSAVPGASLAQGISTTATSQPVQGFYDAVAGTPETTALYYSGGNWNTNTSAGSGSISAHASQYAVPLSPGNAYAAVIVSTPVTNTDNDGILDAWKNGPSAPNFFAGQPGYFDVKTQSWVPLPGAAHGEQDLFVQLDYMCGDVQSGVCQPDGEDLFPSPDVNGNDPLAMVEQAFSQTVVTTPGGLPEKIVLHLEIGNAVQETSCIDSGTQLCEFPTIAGGLQQPGVIDWKNSLELSKVWPRNFTSCAAGGDCTARFPYGQKDSYHYVLFGHSLAVPSWTADAGNIAGISVTSTGTTITSTTAISSCPSRVTIAGVIGEPSLNGVYNTSGCGTNTINVATPSTLTAWTYPNSTLPEPDIGITSSTVTSISGYSDLGGADSAVTLALWETDPEQNMSTRAQVIAGTLFHEIGHTLGLTHGGLSFSGGTGSYIPNFAANCAPNFQSTMNYLFQLDGVGPNGAVAFSNQTLTPLSVTSLAGVTQLLDTDAGSVGAAPTFSTSTWYTPAQPTGSSESQATLHCDGTPLSGDTGYRVSGTVDPLPQAPQATWTNSQNIAFDGVSYTNLPGYNDWSHIDLRQVGATGGEFASLANLLSFGSSSTPLSVPPGGSANVDAGGTVTVGTNGSVTLTSGGSVSVGSGAVITNGGAITFLTGGSATLSNTATGSNTITPGSSGTVSLASGDVVSLSSTGTLTFTGSGGTVTLGGGGNVTLGGGGTISINNGGGTITIPAAGGTYTIPPAGGTVSLASPGVVTLGGGGNVTLGGGGNVTLGGGGNVTLGGGGNVTLGAGGTVTLGGGGNVTLGGGGNITLGGGGTVTLGGGGTVTLGGGGNVTLGGGGNVTLGGGGNVTLGGGGNVTLGAGGTVTLGAGGNVTLGANTTATLSGGGTVTLGAGGNVTLGGGGSVLLSAGGTLTIGGVTVPVAANVLTTVAAGGTITLGGGGNVTLGGGGNITLGGGGTVTLGGGGNVTLGGGGNVTLGGGGVVTLGGGGNVTLGGGGNVTLGGGGNITLGGGGVNTAEMDYTTANSVVRPPPAATYAVIPATGNTPQSIQVNWTAPAFGVVQTYTISREVVNSTGGVIQPNTVIGSVSGVGTPPNVAPPATTFTDTNPPSSGTVLYTISTILIPDTTTGTSRQSAPSPPAVLTMNQTIAFNQLPSSAVITSSPVTVTATASSGLAVSFSASGPCSIGNLSNSGVAYSASVTLSNTGTCTVTASQAGDSTTATTSPAYSAATPVSGSFTILPQGSTALQSQMISFPVPASVMYGASPFQVIATSNAGASVTLSSLTGSTCAVGATTAGTATVTVVGAGLCQIKASAPQTTTYSAASVTQSFKITAAPLTVTAASFTIAYDAPIPALTYTITGFVYADSSSVVSGTPALSTTATQGSSGGTYPIMVLPGSLAAANYSFLYVPGTLTIQQSTTQTITFTTPPPSSAADGTSFTVAATGGASGNPVVFTSSGACGNAGATYTMTAGTGTCVVIANQAGNGSYSAAAQVTKSVTATAGPVITVSPSSINFGAVTVDSITINTVTVTNNGNSAATISTPLLSILGAGNADEYVIVNLCPSSLAAGKSCTIAVSFVAGAYYNTPQTATLKVMDNAPGSPQQVALTATVLIPQAITFTTNPPTSAVYNSRFTVAATGGGSGNPVTFTSSGSCSNTSATYTMTSGTGTCSVIANQAGNSTYAASRVTKTVTATPATQTITLTTPPPSSAAYKSSFTVAATASSGLAVTFTSSGSCSNAGATYTMTSSSGTCSVIASQAGNSNYAAAPKVTQTVTATVAAQTITFTTRAPSTAAYRTSFTVAATGGGSGNAVTFKSSGSCSNAGATYTMTSGAGTCSVIANQAGNSSYSAAPQVTETVTAIYSTASLTPGSLSFGTVSSGKSSSAQTATLTNTGTTPLIISSVGFTGTNSSNFTQTNTCPSSSSSLAAGKSCTISVTFKSSGTAAVASLAVTDNTQAGTQTVSLSGN